VEIYYNSTGLDAVNFCGVGELAKHFSVAEMLDRDNFAKRYEAGQRISLQEFLYPLMQGYDSVALKADVELGGNDQYFNLLAGRTLQAAFGQPKQDIMTFDLLLGTDGRKMSKTLPNAVPLSATPEEKFVKVMEVKDELIGQWYRLVTTRSLADIAVQEKRLASGEHPRDVKLDLASAVVEAFHGAEAAVKARKYFEEVVAGGARPDDAQIPTFEMAAGTYPLVTVLREAGLVGNSTEARNALLNGGTLVDGAEIRDVKHQVAITAGGKVMIQVGKKKFRNVVGK
jgi:tyrosyl-tRNA synthetase